MGSIREDGMKRLGERLTRRMWVVVPLLCTAAPVFGQVTPASDQPEAANPPAVPGTEAPAAGPPVATEAAAPQGGRSYTPEDFVRFAPRNALDMLNQVPGFAIDEGDTERRGLGEATANVLFNGERFSSKSVDIFTELRRISAANVVRIEIVDGATLAVPGLSGQVANVVTASTGLTGNFIWRPQIRTERTPFRWSNVEASINGTLGGTQYSLSFRNDSYRNGNAGPELVFTPDGTVTDWRDEVLSVDGDQPRLSATIRRNFGDGSILNANAAFGLFNNDLQEVSLRSGPGQPDRERVLNDREREHNYEFGGDYEFPMPGGRMKLIGLHRFEHSPFSQTLVQTFSDGSPATGQRFTQVADESETIARGEYRWDAGRSDWQVSLEGALNSLDIENNLFTLDSAGAFVPLPFPNSAALVEEQRIEALVTWGRPLAEHLTMQAQLGGEWSELRQSGAGGLTRAFVRPKGFISLAWTPRTGLDISARLARVVGQLNFFDFVASANASAGTVNSGNADLVPPQSWDGEVQATRNLGAWGTVTARFYGRLISDIVDIIPVNGGQSVGNLDSASIYGVQWTSTFNFDPAGWRGAKLDLNLQFQHTSLEDPVTGLDRPINENMTSQIEVNLRHDIPGSDWAWGGTFFRYRQAPLFRLDERWQFVDTPGNLGVFVEHKDVFGLTVRAGLDNLLDTNESFRRDFYLGDRNGPVRLTEDRDRFYGQVFTLTITGTI
ncbi:MAG: TonB-dependent receptor plug domain-containing protein [Allosphingosinicella sp.]